MEKNPIEMLMDEENSENIILYNEDGEAVEFEQIALIDLDGTLFAMLHPVVLTEDIEEDTGLVFRICVYDGEEVLEIEEDVDVIDAVFEEYYAMLKDAGVDVDAD